MNDLPILIAGGGIGGTATALALSRKGMRSVVLEQAQTLGEIGAGIQMPPNAFKAFRALGVLEAVERVAAYPERLVLGDMLTGKPVFQTEIGEEFIRRFGFRYALMHRGDLLQILLDACRASDLIALRTSSRITHFRDVGDRIAVTTATGDEHEGAGLIAADGLWSQTRATLFGAEAPSSDSYIVCRGVVPVSQIPEELYSQSVTMWGGPELDLFHYPLRRSEIFNIGASYRDPELASETAAAAAKLGAPPPKGDRDLMRARFRDACPHVQAMLEHIDVSRAWVLYDRPPIATWSRGRVALLGDAAHPTTIYISQGACMALEDAVLIAEMLLRTDDIAEAFRAYAAARHLRTARVHLTSRQFGEVYHASGVMRALRNHLLAETPGSALYDTLGWLFGDVGADSITLSRCAM